jgi:mono/diheme cytochrome c family protein
MISIILLMVLVSACSKEEPAASEPAKSVAGDEVFQKSCIACHSSGDIAGGQSKLDADKIHGDFSDKTELYDFVSKKMPKSAPGTLSKEKYEAVVNFLWDQE